MLAKAGISYFVVPGCVGDSCFRRNDKPVFEMIKNRGYECLCHPLELENVCGGGLKNDAKFCLSISRKRASRFCCAGDSCFRRNDKPVFEMIKNRGCECLGHPPSFLQETQKGHILKKKDEKNINLKPSDKSPIGAQYR